MTHHKNIALIGYRGTGKKYLGKLLAEELNQSFICTDTLIEAFHPATRCKDIYHYYGKEYFYYLESRVIRRMEHHPVPVVIATGGTTLLLEENAHSLKKHSKLVFLQSSPALLLKELLNKVNLTTHPEHDFEDLPRQNTSLFEKWADVIIDLEKMNFQEIVHHLTASFAHKS